MKTFLHHIALVLTLFLASGSAFGTSWVSGLVLEQDGLTPIVGATVAFAGEAELGNTLSYQFVTDSLGSYEGEVEAGTYWVCALADGYVSSCLPDSLWLMEGQYADGLDFWLLELRQPVSYVAARHFENNLVRVSWSMHDPLLVEDFETGDFGKFNWDQMTVDFPWVVDSVHAMEGRYCMKSSCEGQSEGRSQIEVSVYIPLAGRMSFWSKISSEPSWDLGAFYLDGVKKWESSGTGDWEEHRFDISEGEHVFRWRYKKDSSHDEGDDCLYVDNIHFFLEKSKETAAKADQSLQYYDLFRRRLGDEPVLLASHLPDTMFMEMGWKSLPWGRYQWGVACWYEGNRPASDTIWSGFLDKDMTTVLGVKATTNVGLFPAGALVTLSSESGQNYQATLDAEGEATFTEVYRNNYTVRVQLDGFEDFVTDEPLPIFEPSQIEIELKEKLMPIDSLYVSSTGWGVWHLDSLRLRDLQYFEVKLNSHIVGTTTDCYFQFDEAGLETGKRYVAKVRPVYLSSACEWATHEWNYRHCSDFQGNSNFNWTLQEEAVKLSWTYPDNDSVTGAEVFRNGDCLGFVTDNYFLDSTATLQGTLDYCVRMVYDGQAEGSSLSMSCADCLQADFPAYCDPPQKLEAENYWESDSDYGAVVSWGERPEPFMEWLHYDNGEYKNAVGGTDEPVIFWSVRFDASQLTEYQGTSLKKISLFDVGAGSYQLWVYVGGEDAPRTMVRFHEMTLNGSFTWHEQVVSPAMEIPENEPVWIVVGQQGVHRPAAACADQGNPDGRWVSLDGIEWHDINYYNLHYTWMLRAFVSNRAGKTVRIGNDGFVLQQYNLYRSYDNTDYQIVASIPTIEGQSFYQYRDVLVGTEHSTFYYKLKALYLSDEGEECESDFALSLYQPDKDFVMVDDHWKVTENPSDKLVVYPNPSSGRLTIRAKGMCHICVFNILGQSLLDRELQSDEAQLDLDGFADGVYQLLVTTETGLCTKRFVLSK